MVKEIGDRAASVIIQELGTRCWLPRRFIKGKRCDRFYLCKYPEKKTCQAALAEIDHLKEYKQRLWRLIQRVERLILNIRLEREK